MSNETKAAQLGMPFGTACGRLRKIVLWSLLKKHNENLCFRCGQEIETVEDLSLEHKQPWEGVSVALFWDLENIAFSHLICNIKGARKPWAYATEEERRAAILAGYQRTNAKRYTPQKRHDQYLRTGK